LFVIWGGLHGTYLMIERMISREKLAKIKLYPIFVFVAVSIAWVFFRSDNLEFANQVARSCLMFEGIENFSSSGDLFGVPIPEFVRTYGGLKLMAAIGFTFILIRFVPNTNQLKFKMNSITVIALALVLVFCLMHVDKPSPFLYFQF